MSVQAVLLSFKKMIHAHCGLVLEGIAEDRLHKALVDNSAQSGCASLLEYEQLVRRDQQQFDQLISQLTVNETYFFREVEQIQLLTEALIPQVLAHKQQCGPVRILSAGCSSGEEPYSLVMALQHLYGERAAQLFQVDAGDVDLRILEKARQGVYSEFSFRGVAEHWRKRYFRTTAAGYQLLPLIREQVRFYPLNLLAMEKQADLKHYDIIFFRNVSIYFDMDTRREIHRTFHQLMNENAILFLGSSEIFGNDLGVFELVEQQGQYFFIKGQVYRGDSQQANVCLPLLSQKGSAALLREQSTRTISAPSKPLLPVQTPRSQLSAAPEPIRDAANTPDLAMIQQLIHFGETQRALHLLEHLLVHDEQNTAAHILKIWILLNNQAFAEAEPLLQAVLETAPWLIDALVLQGLSCKWQDEPERAQQWFKKAVYTSPECWPAQYYLADLNRQQGLGEAALKTYQTVVRILTANPTASDCMQWIPLPLPVGDVLFLSQRHIQQLRTKLSISSEED